MSLCLLPLPALAEPTVATVPDTAYASVMRTINPRLAPTQSLAYATALLTNARTLHVDPTLVMAIVTVESHWNTRALSNAGARGLGQLEPETARALGVNAWSSSQNLRGVTLYLHRLLAIFGTSREAMREAIAGYNAGPVAVKNYGGIPPYHETRRYVVKVMRTWHAMRSRLGNVPLVEPSEFAAAMLAAQRVEATNAAYWNAGTTGASAL